MITIDLNNLQSEALQFAIDNGIIDIREVLKQSEQMQREQILKEHPYKIWQGKNGRWYTYVQDDTRKEGRKRIPKSNLKDLEDAIIDSYNQNNIFINQIFEEWIKYKIAMKEISQGTVNRYENDFIKYFSKSNLSQIPVKLITADDINDFVEDTIKANELTAKAFSNIRTVLFGVFRYAKKKKLTSLQITLIMNDIQISRKSFVKKVKFKEKEIYDIDEQTMIKEYILANKDILNLGILFAMQTGVRVGELAAIEKADINLKDKTLQITKTEVKYKNNDGVMVYKVKNYPKSDAGIRYVYLPDTAIETSIQLFDLNPDGKYLFEVNGERIRTYQFSSRIGFLCNTLNITQKSMHKIRRTYGTTLIDNNVDESFIINQMGHSDIQTTKKYYYYSNKNNKTKLEQINKSITI